MARHRSHNRDEVGRFHVSGQPGILHSYVQCSAVPYMYVSHCYVVVSRNGRLHSVHGFSGSASRGAAQSRDATKSKYPP